MLTLLGAAVFSIVASISFTRAQNVSSTAKPVQAVQKKINGTNQDFSPVELQISTTSKERNATGIVSMIIFSQS